MKIHNTFIDALKAANIKNTVLCALSGGADSVCLLSLLNDVKLSGIRVAACHLNHGIRGMEADRDEEFSRMLAEKLDIEFFSKRIDVPKLCQNSGRSIEEEARLARYEYFGEVCEKLGTDTVMTAHHRGDNAETLILNLCRGTGLAGASGIPFIRQCGTYRVVRPLLFISKEEIVEYLDINGIKYITDSTNLCDDYSRNHVRHKVIPQLCKINSNAEENIARSIANLRTDLDFITQMTDEAMKKAECSDTEAVYPAKELADMHDALKTRVISRLFADVCKDREVFLSSANLTAVSGLLYSNDPSGEVSLPCGIRAQRRYGKLVMTSENMKPLREYELHDGTVVTLWDAGYKIICKKTDRIYNNLNTFTVECCKIDGILCMRARREGDSIKPLGRNWTKTVKKAMIDLKIPREYRQTLPVIADDAGVVAVYGIGTDVRCAARQSGDNIMIQIQKIAGGSL